MLKIKINRGPNFGESFTFEYFPITMGRDKANKIVLSDTEVSRFHVKIKKRGKLFILEDLDSKNGCYLNGEKVVNSIIQNNDSIIIGNTEFKISTPLQEINFEAHSLDIDLDTICKSGIYSPVNLSSDIEELPESINPFRSILSNSIFNERNFNFIKGVKLNDLYSDVLVAESLEDVCEALLKSTHKICKKISRGSVFVLAAHKYHLIPIAVKHFDGKKTPFKINKRGLSEAINLKQGVVIKSEKNETVRIVLPMVYHNKVIALFHLEVNQEKVDNIKKYFLNIESLIEKCAPILESVLLRSEIDSILLSMVQTVIATIEAKDTYTIGHSERVCKYSMAIADKLMLNREVRKMLMVSSLCHDIGKIGIPDAILKKATLLSIEEYEEMKLHPTIGANIISNMPNAKRFLSGIKYHHEKWDGTGYPEGLMGEDIPFFGRIVSVADVFDAMISGRAYSGFIDEAEAISKIQEEKELFDPEIVKALVKAWEDGSISQRTSTVLDKDPMKKYSKINIYEDFKEKKKNK